MKTYSSYERLCKPCNIIKLLCEFKRDKKYKNGRGYVCLKCSREKTKRNYNYELRKEYMRSYRIKNKDKLALYDKQKHLKNYTKNKDKIKERVRKYANENKEKLKSYFLKNKTNIYLHRKLKIKNDPLYKLKITISNRMREAIKSKKMTINVKYKDFIGADIPTVKKHIERQFKKGMSWENHGEWEIDHKIPLAYAKNESELFNLFHYTNLQPLWASENRKKSSKLTNNFQLLLTI